MPTAHSLPDLPFAADALAPVISAETFSYHHGKHHRAYVDKLNKLVAGTELEGKSVEEVVKQASGGVFDNAAQHFNHSFYWNSLSPDRDQTPEGALAEAIDDAFGSFDTFRERFTRASVGLFGSGWCWLVRGSDGKLAIETTENAGCPLTAGQLPLLTCDLWEHAYYIDYRNARRGYVEKFWTVANWRFAEECFGAGG